MHVCVDVCMDIWIEKSHITEFLNEICTQLGTLRCKIDVVVFLRELTT